MFSKGILGGKKKEYLKSILKSQILHIFDRKEIGWWNRALGSMV